MAACLATGGVLLALMLLAAGTASAQQAGVPTLSAVAGQPFGASGAGSELLDGSCVDLRNVLVNWHDGTESAPGSAALVDAGTVDVGGTPVPVKRVSVTVSHVFPIPALYEVSLSYDVTCDSPGGPVDFHEDHDPLFNVNAQAGSGTGGLPTSCTLPGGEPAVSSLLPAQVTLPTPTQVCTFRPNENEKAVLRAFGTYSLNSAKFEFAIGKILLYTPELLVSKVAAAIEFDAAYLRAAAANAAFKVAKDPPDPRFQSVAPPVSVRVIHVHGGGSLTKAEAARLNRYLAGLARVAALHGALLTAIERAAGAVEAGSEADAQRQTLAAAHFASELADGLDRLGPRTKAAVKALGDARMKVDRRAARRAKRAIGRDGLPPAMWKLIRQFGADGLDAGRRLRLGVARSLPKELTGRFPADLAAAGLLRAYHKEAQALRSYANRANAG